MRRELSRHGWGPASLRRRDALEQAIVRCSMLVTFGGDGTMLTVSSLAAAHHVPLAGREPGTPGIHDHLFLYRSCRCWRIALQGGFPS